MFTVATVLLSLVTLAGIILWSRDRKRALMRQKAELPPLHLRKKQLDEEILDLEKQIEFLKSKRKKMDEETS
jgi:peptidoglycan hydrolase CwlO-like protein